MMHGRHGKKIPRRHSRKLYFNISSPDLLYTILHNFIKFQPRKPRMELWNRSPYPMFMRKLDLRSYLGEKTRRPPSHLSNPDIGPQSSPTAPDGDDEISGFCNSVALRKRA